MSRRLDASIENSAEIEDFLEHYLRKFGEIQFLKVSANTDTLIVGHFEVRVAGIVRQNNPVPQDRSAEIIEID